MWKFDSAGALTALSHGDSDTGVWVPSEQMVFCRAELPPGYQGMQEQTVAFALEEQLVMPVEEQHFAIGQADGGKGSIPVCVVSLQVMEAWCDALREKGVKPRAIWPDVLAVPFEEGRPVLWHEGGRCLLRLGLQAGLVGSPEWIGSMLEIVNQTDAVRVFSDAAEALPEALRERAESLPGSLEDQMLAGPDEGAVAVNFMQGAFRPVSAVRIWGAPWGWTAAAAVAVFALYLGSLAAEIRVINAATASLKGATVELHKRHFPEQELLSDLRTQVGRRMNQVRKGVVNREVNPWQTLVSVEPVISSCKACRVEKVELKKSTVLLVMSSSAAFDKLLAKIQRLKGVKVNTEPLSDNKERKKLRLKLTVEKTV